MRVFLAAICALAFPAHGAGCDAISGTYRFEGKRDDGKPAFLTQLFASGRGTPSFFAPLPADQLARIRRGEQSRPTPIARTVTLSRSGEVLSVSAADAKGARLHQATLYADQWQCRDGRLYKTTDVTAGLGDVSRVERAVETFEKGGGGELVYRRQVTVVSGEGKKPPDVEQHFAAAKP